jgi:membrane associated rhomboid family serine protease
VSDRPKLCSECGKLMGVGQECPYCGADNGALRVKLKRAARAAGDDDSGGLTVTRAFVIVNVFLFATGLIVGGTGPSLGFDFFTPNLEVAFRMGLQNTMAIDAGHWWRLVLPIFLHLGLLHVAFNCYMLNFAGQLIEEDLGAHLMFVITMGSGLAGTLGSYVFDIGGGGASGAVLGLIGAVLVRRRLVDGNFKHPMTRQLVSLLGLNVVIWFFMSAHINHVAHGAGFVAGSSMAWLFSRKALGKVGAVVVLATSWSLAGLTLAAFGAMVLSLFSGSAPDVDATTACWREAAAAVSPRFVPDDARRALTCLDDAPRLEAAANTAVQDGAAALRDAISAYDDGDSARYGAAVKAVEQSLLDYASWRDDATPRYVPLVRRRPGDG